MQFKDVVVGQIVELVDNRSMRASKGATGIVKRVNEVFVWVKWKTGYKCPKTSRPQVDGDYFLSRFKPAIKKGEQLLFNFAK